jgi:hypothetical protein
MAGKHGEKARGGGLTDMDGWSAGVRARSAAEEEEGGESFGGCCGWEEEEEEGKVRGIRARRGGPETANESEVERGAAAD